MLRLERVGKIYPTGEVLRDVTWEVKSGDRIGLVGVNGAGKSTQLRIIAGLEEPSSGQVVRQGDPRIVFLQQEFDVDVRRTVREELFQAFGEAAEVRNQQGQVELAMASERAAEDPDHLQELIEVGVCRPALKGCMATSWMLASTSCCPRLALTKPRLSASLATTQAAGKCGSPWARSCCRSPICCCSMSPPTTSTWPRLSGWRATSLRSMCRWW